jgi:hypothetical protein
LTVIINETLLLNEFLKPEINTSPSHLKFISPRFLLQAANDPTLPNKWPDSPLPRIPTNLGENILRNILENLQLAIANIFLNKMQ